MEGRSEMTLRGNDIVGVALDGNRSRRFLKGESKSRAALNDTMVTEAASTTCPARLSGEDQYR